MDAPSPLFICPPEAVPSISCADPEECAVDRRMLDKTDALIHERYPRMRSFLLIRHRKLIYERYYGGHALASLNDLRSATKSVTSLLAGISNARGELPPLETSVSSVLSRFVPPHASPMLGRITIRHLLTMTSGFAWQTGTKLGEPLIRRFHRSRNWTAFALSLPIQEAEIGQFQYRSIDSYLLSVVISESTGIPAHAYATRHLFSPLGIRHAVWSPSPEGHSMGHVGLYLTSRDMAKIGVCCLEGGRWNQQAVIPSDWLEEALAPQTKGYGAFGDYGYQWWNGQLSGFRYALAHGHGGQQMYLFPELDAVVVFTADSRVSRWRNPRMLLERYILKAMQPD
ncbi:serine hydrolase [Paenibacillus cisolokensis]|uniref:serine hydrolase domain-containing protein n=1 Tax=Paenibacillus cisolokensis TaxID=1658519 RepID=UPI003D2AF147